MGKHITVTGGAGFVGCNLVRHLLATDGIDGVRVIDDLSSGFRSNLTDVEDQIDLVIGSFNDRDALDEALDGADAIVHLGARPSVPRSIEDPVASHLANATGTLAVLEGARRHGDLQTIVASSSSVYGANPTLPKSEDLLTAPLSPYAVSKLATEQYALAYSHCYNLPTLAFRLFNVYGPYQAAGHAYAAVIPAFLDAALDGRPVTVHGDGAQTRDFTFVGSVTAAITDAILRGVRSPEPVNLAFGTRASLLELIDVIADVLGRPVEREHVATRAGDVRHSQADQSRFANLFRDLEAKPLRDGIAATVEWFERQRAQS